MTTKTKITKPRFEKLFWRFAYHLHQYVEIIDMEGAVDDAFSRAIEDLRNGQPWMYGVSSEQLAQLKTDCKTYYESRVSVGILPPIKASTR